MITAIATLLLLFLVGTIFNFTYVEDFWPTITTISCIAIIIILLFRIAHRILSKDKIDNYKKKWEVPIIHFHGFLYSMVTFLLILKIIMNYNSNTPFLEHTLIFWIIIIAYDIVNVFIIFHTYLFDLKRAIIDSYMFQIRNVWYALIFFIIFMFILKLTIVGFIILFIIISSIISIFIK